MPTMTNELAPYREILEAAHLKRFREWEPKIRLLADSINAGSMVLPHDPVLRQSLLAMQERNGHVDMSTVDSNCQMLANALWDAQQGR